MEPRLNIPELTIERSACDGVHLVVLSGELDLGVVTLPIPAGLTGQRLEITPWLTDELVLLVPREHPLAARRRFQWRDLHGQPLIAFESGSAVRQLLDRQLAELREARTVVLSTHDLARVEHLSSDRLALA